MTQDDASQDDLFPKALTAAEPKLPPKIKKDSKKKKSGKSKPAKFEVAALAEVAFNLPIGPYSYGVKAGDESSYEVGALVEVRLRGKKEVGVVIGLSSLPEDLERASTIKGLQPVLGRVAEPYALTSDLLEMAEWMSDYYMCPIGEALACLAFFGLRDAVPSKKVRVWRLNNEPLNDEKEGSEPPSGLETEGDDKDAAAERAKQRLSLTRRQRQVVEWLQNRGDETALTSKQFHEEIGVTEGVLKRLAEAGWLVAEEISPEDIAPEPRDFPFENQQEESAGDSPARALELMPDQTAALGAINAALDAEKFAGFLLQGVTGSGKTEVYLRALERALDAGRQGVVLVPEIGLTPQTVGRFEARFPGRVGVYHSRLTPHEKWRLWRQINEESVQVLIGARSALFAPFPNLGLIVVDEEHEGSYKQDATPRYHARDVALWRAAKCGKGGGAVAILGSATPSLESSYNVELGKLTRLRLRDRVGGALPPVELIDMNREAREGGIQGHLSRPLRLAMRDVIAEGEQVLLLLNRRGYTSFFNCPKCQEAIQCPHCSVTLTHHIRGDKLVCHLCGYSDLAPRECPKCGDELLRLGIGTERLEEELDRLFPGKRIKRLDQDTMRGKHAWSEVWRELEAGDFDILFGTQMIAKGLHLEKITLVGVVLADMTLHQPDFRAQERAFSLITQVAGRAGRGKRAGKVMVQTYAPQHYALRLASDHDYDLFYREELHRRRPSLPPLNRLILTTLAGKDRRETERHIRRLTGEIQLRARAIGPDAPTLLGPRPAPIERIKDHWRWRFALAAPNLAGARALLRSALATLDNDLPRAWRHHQLTLDVDPQDWM